MSLTQLLCVRPFAVQDDGLLAVNMSLYPFMLSAGATGSYAPLAVLVNGICTTLKPVGGWRSQDPWNVTYMFLASASNVFQMGALWAWKVNRGAVALLLQLASLKVLLGLSTKWLPVLSAVLSVKEEASQTEKQVG